MKNIWTITKKELKSFLYSPIAYILTSFFLLVSGFFFYNILAWANDQTMRMMQSGYGMNRININQMLFEPFFNNMTIILMFLLPMLTMRLFADEKKMRTEELLLTSPLRLSAIIIGKYLAALIIYTIILLLTATYAIFVFIYGNPELAPLLTAYLGLFLLGAVFIAIGLFASALTENQVIAAVISFSSILLIWVISWVGESGPGAWRGILTYLSFFSHFKNMVSGVIDTQDIVYYLTFIFLGLYLTRSVFEFRKWR
ncbi:MAG: ABC transporter permease subunit [Acidobacteria bacterium]|nr:ABC transporter permease subunit [Acidobacteriota bacterium]MBU4307549.1 ABC transporter permease subunit [Acidobacteriota bacterium]MCG2811276.1 ABC transporter permease subunit [Candidatus Aminicenantes bacterium]HUU05889.1 ABC transporter permease subunit [Patescibacteria group bacterium]